jgi:integrase
MKEHVAQRGKTFTYWIDTGRDETGKRRRETKGGFVSEALARAAARRLLVQIEKEGGYQKPTKETVESFMRRWLKGVKSRTRPSTLEMYTVLAEKHIIPHLGAIEVSKLTVSQVNAFYGQVLESGRRDGKGGLSPRTVGHIHGCLRSALNEALKEDIIGRNVAMKASPPRKQPKALNVWSTDEARAFLVSVQHDRLFGAYALLLVTGLRRGELLGLAWRDIDLDAGWLHVRQTLATVNYKTVQISIPKTQKRAP